jgi:hypothetical protein
MGSVVRLVVDHLKLLAVQMGNIAQLDSDAAETVLAFQMEDSVVVMEPLAMLEIYASRYLEAQMMYAVRIPIVQHMSVMAPRKHTQQPQLLIYFL